MEVYHNMLLYTTLQWREDTTRYGIANDNIILTLARGLHDFGRRRFVVRSNFCVDRLLLLHSCGTPICIHLYITNNVYIRMLPEAHTRVFSRAQTRHPRLSTLRNGKLFIGP